MKKWNNKSELSRTWQKEDLNENLLLQRGYPLTQTPIMESDRILAFFFLIADIHHNINGKR